MNFDQLFLLVAIGSFILGGLAVVMPKLAGAVYKNKAYKLLENPSPSATELREVIGGLSHSKDAEAKRLGDDLNEKLRKTYLS